MWASRGLARRRLNSSGLLDFGQGVSRRRYPVAFSRRAPVCPTAEAMVSNTIQCGFESHPGHPVGGPRDDGASCTRTTSGPPALARLAGGVPIAAVSRSSGIAAEHPACLARRPVTLRGQRRVPPLRGRPARHRRLCRAAGLLPRGRLRHGDARGTLVLRVSCDASPPPRRSATSHDCLRAVRAGLTVFHVEAPGTVVVQGHWKHWPCLFPQHGPGRKHERPIVLEHVAARRSSPSTPATSCAGCSTPTARGSRTGRRAWWPASAAATTTRAGSSATAPRTSSRCAAGRSTSSASPGAVQPDPRQRLPRPTSPGSTR